MVAPKGAAAVPAFERICRVQCPSPECPDYMVIKIVPLPHLGEGVYMDAGGTGGGHVLFCGICPYPGPMNRLFGNLRD